MKVFVLTLASLAMVLAEPPVPSNRYLPATFNTGLAKYEAPVQRNIPSSSYGVPTQYSVPSQQYLPSQYNSHSQQSIPSYNTPSVQYDSPIQYNQYESSQSITPSSQYGVPSQYNAPSSNYGVPSQYNAPSSNYGAPSVRSNAPSTTYGIPSARSSVPSASYGVPSARYGAPSIKYGVPSARYGVPDYSRANYEEHSEPANYNFQYDVQEQHEGTDFGHAETRQGENAQGRYYVTLPDGRKQTVDYTADEQGFKPQISYQQTNNYASRYSGNYNNQGYVNGGYAQNSYEHGY